uniref:NADH-cytochrome b5 reductase 2-like n=1 Tax=Diabrotica virgifera virgifera TaxID=50390 RepID=A0A6P7FQ36_DIAVI
MDLVKRLLVDPKIKYKMKLYKKVNANRNVRIFTFKLPEDDMILGHACGQHCLFHAKIGGKDISRTYSPTSICSTRGYAEFMIKIYFKNEDPKFPAGGKMSQHLDSLKIGDVIQVSNPSGKVIYKGGGKFYITHKAGTLVVNTKKLGFIVGGIGITPVIQMLRTIIADPLDGINCTLIYASKTEADIIGKEELNETAKKMSGRLKIWHTLEQPPPDWRFGKGFVSKDMMRDHLFPPSTQSLNLLSGPYPMLKALAKQLSDLGYSKQMYSRYF